jgi:hypothetical protein
MSRILFVFEGVRTEKKLMTSLKSFFLTEKEIITCAYGAEIYQLYKKISEDIDLDTFILLLENPLIYESLKDFKRDDFSEIYLFFDYDGHSSLADDDTLEEMLNIFDEETQAGKLLINYPMVESIKHLSDSLSFQSLKVNAKNNIRYKQIVNSECENIYMNFNKYSKEIWICIIESHLKKMNFLATNQYSFPIDQCSQKIIFSKQRENYINKDSTVAVLNAFPIFLFDYYGGSRLKIILLL